MTTEQISKLKELKELLDKGILTTEEVEREKQRILQESDSSFSSQTDELESEETPNSDDTILASKRRSLFISLAVVALLTCLSIYFTNRQQDNYEGDDEWEEYHEGDDLLSSPLSGTEDGHEWVDLGLPSGVKWATCNIGASSPEEYGDYFAWGETLTKEEDLYGDDHYKFFTYEGVDDYDVNKYNETDRLTVLALIDDAAHVILGGKWRLPTKEEFEELYANCRWEWNSIGEQKVYCAVSKINGESILFPACGYYTNYWSIGPYEDEIASFYWTSTLDTSGTYSHAYSFAFWEPEEYMVKSGASIRTDLRSVGAPIRPVFH